MTNLRRQSMFCFPGYRWCGPWCSGPGQPINQVDACCMYHDQCLRSGFSPCACDERFMECLRPMMHGPYPMNRHARIMYSAMRLRRPFVC